MNFKIQSISDVITNSSTEVYVVYYSCDKTAIINIVNSILAINSDSKFEDYFEFEWIPNEDFLYSKWEDDEIDMPFTEWVNTLSEDDLFDDYENWNDIRNFVSGYKITAKDPKNAEAAQLLSTLDNLFSMEASYNG